MDVIYDQRMEWERTIIGPCQHRWKRKTNDNYVRVCTRCGAQKGFES
jgi:hypothetical protein